MQFTYSDNMLIVVKFLIAYKLFEPTKFHTVYLQTKATYCYKSRVISTPFNELWIQFCTINVLFYNIQHSKKVSKDDKKKLNWISNYESAALITCYPSQMLSFEYGIINNILLYLQHNHPSNFSRLVADRRKVKYGKFDWNEYNQG